MKRPLQKILKKPILFCKKVGGPWPPAPPFSEALVGKDPNSFGYFTSFHLAYSYWCMFIHTIIRANNWEEKPYATLARGV